jgi:hypothetical protein
VAILKCQNGHFYDNVKYSICPHCSELLPESEEENKTVSLKADAGLAKKQLNALIHEEKTVSLSRSAPDLTADPVVGWLVCTDGPEKGRDYRIHAGRNFLGRSLKMDIAITDDNAITREQHCSVVYDPQSSNFFIVAGTGTNTYVNGARLSSPKRLNDGETLRIGGSAFCFVAYCKEGRTWS